MKITTIKTSIKYMKNKTHTQISTETKNYVINKTLTVA